jgi:hypothetical protein|tara:strand:+ start:3275 stop:3538 length:264 start_codon:yes stop_codon:yes gene_type:complete
MGGARVAFGRLSSILLVSLSIASFMAEGYVTTETWGFLLLTPLTLALALAPATEEMSGKSTLPDDYWDKEDEGIDPVGESDFDNPIL